LRHVEIIFARFCALRAGSACLRRCLYFHAVGHRLMFLSLAGRNSTDCIDAFLSFCSEGAGYLLPRLRGGVPASSDGGMSSAVIPFFLDKMSRPGLWMRIRA